MAGMGYAVMGTAMRTGANRAVEAAMAAMASPLLEAGAIDGARGILINITGSSSLKLSEVNEASTIIQNAAHEDANIIFGAVQDETMGDEVKITVIATGFKQQEMPQRRERMLAESTLPTMRYDVPIQPRVVTPRPTPRFASEPEPEPMSSPVVEGKEKSASNGHGAAPELVPVKASVFDDDFFQASLTREELVFEGNGMEGGLQDRSHLSGSGRVKDEEIRGVTEDVFPVEASARMPFVGSSVAAAEHAEPDELDIPAFLRRGNG
jgi:cell division protein FtsZ